MGSALKEPAIAYGQSLSESAPSEENFMHGKALGLSFFAAILVCYVGPSHAQTVTPDLFSTSLHVHRIEATMTSPPHREVHSFGVWVRISDPLGAFLCRCHRQTREYEKKIFQLNQYIIRPTARRLFDESQETVRTLPSSVRMRGCICSYRPDTRKFQ